MKRYPLSLYVIGVVIVLAIANCVAWFVRGGTRAENTRIFSGGFLVGMLAMYIAMHIYKHK